MSLRQMYNELACWVSKANPRLPWFVYIEAGIIFCVIIWVIYRGSQFRSTNRSLIITIPFFVSYMFLLVSSLVIFRPHIDKPIIIIDFWNAIYRAIHFERSELIEMVLNEDYGLPGSTCPDFGKHDSG